MSKQYICQLQFEPGHNKSVCGKCYHAYPHKHKKNCNGNHCKESNQYNSSWEMKRALTCQLITDTKEDPIVISNVKIVKEMR